MPVSAVRVNSRVYSRAQEAGLGRQAGRLAARTGPWVNGARPEVRRLLAGLRVDVMAAAHRGRPGRVNAGLAGAVPSAHGRRLVVLGGGEPGDGLLRDVAGVLASFCGRRPARDRAGRALRCAARDVGPSFLGVAG